MRQFLVEVPLHFLVFEAVAEPRFFFFVLAFFFFVVLGATSSSSS